MDKKLNIMIMSGVEDGNLLTYHPAQGDGEQTSLGWVLTIGRRDENDLCLRYDAYVSRYHARIIWNNDDWLLEDLESTNGSFFENVDDFFDDIPIKGTVPLQERQLFRVGRTWLQFEITE